MLKLLNKLYLHAGVGLTTGAMLLDSNSAMASGGGSGINAAAVSKNIGEASTNFPQLIATVAYIGGVGLGVTGIFKLKQHVDNPQTPMKDGLARLGAGGGLLALPYLTQVMVGNVADNGSGVTFDTTKGNLGGISF